jgi:hypothetical protein
VHRGDSLAARHSPLHHLRRCVPREFPSAVYCGFISLTHLPIEIGAAVNSGCITIQLCQTEKILPSDYLKRMRSLHPIPDAKGQDIMI